MNESPPLVIRRILVALDASQQSLAALEAAIDLAAKMNAELLGLFVQDVALARLADIPYVREVPHFSITARPLTRESVESKFRAQAEQARSSLAAIAERAGVAWSFRTVRGEIASEILAAAAEVDLLALGTGGWTIGHLRMGSTALRIAESSVPALLLPG